MTPRTAYTELLQETGWSLREWSRRSGLSLNTLRALSGGRSLNPQRRTRAALAAALRESGQRFLAIADQLEHD
jgi:hypothetical protein